MPHPPHTRIKCASLRWHPAAALACGRATTAACHMPACLRMPSAGVHVQGLALAQPAVVGSHSSETQPATQSKEALVRLRPTKQVRRRMPSVTAPAQHVRVPGDVPARQPACPPACLPACCYWRWPVQPRMCIGDHHWCSAAAAARYTVEACYTHVTVLKTWPCVIGCCVR
jgi:hypothetical protein